MGSAQLAITEQEIAEIEGYPLSAEEKGQIEIAIEVLKKTAQHPMLNLGEACGKSCFRKFEIAKIIHAFESVEMPFSRLECEHILHSVLQEASSELLRPRCKDRSNGTFLAKVKDKLLNHFLGEKKRGFNAFVSILEATSTEAQSRKGLDKKTITRVIALMRKKARKHFLQSVADTPPPCSHKITISALCGRDGDGQ